MIRASGLMSAGRKFGVVILVALCLAGCSPITHQPPGAATYAEPARQAPSEDPIVATVLGTPPVRRANLLENVPIERYTIGPIVERPTPPTLAYARPLHYMLTAQPEPAPLMVLIAGTGAGAKSAKCKLLSRVFYEVGYSVICLPSPTSVSFILGAARHPVPGRMPADVASLARLLRAVLEDADGHAEITGLSLGGWSLGATQAAFLARRAVRRDSFEFSQVLLINPAVSIWTSVKRMDRLLANNIPGGVSGVPAFIANVLGDLKRFYGGGRPLSFDKKTLYSLYRSDTAGRRQLAGAIGLVFRLALANMALAADTLAEIGVVIPEGVELGRYDSREAAMRQAFSLSFQAYVKKMLLPYWNRGDRHLTLEALIREDSLRSIAGFLKRNERIEVVTNADDIILSEQDVAFLRRVFGERAHIRPNGGHMGNIASKKTVHMIQQAVTS